MKHFCLFALIVCNVVGQAQIVNIPDANFKNALVNTNCVDIDGNNTGDIDADINDDGEIQVSEAEAVLNLVVSSNNIASLQGIQSFTNLEIIWCSGNQLTDLSFTSNSSLIGIDCSNNVISSIDLSQCQNLVWLDIYDNEMSEIDVSQNLNLEILNCRNNNLINIDVSQNVALEALYCANNELSEIDLTLNNQLAELVCSFNELTVVNVQNGNTSNLDVLNTLNNPTLYCIQVDDEEYANSVDYWDIDDWTNYGESCILGIQENTRINFTPYPNPVEAILFLEAQQPIETIKIYNARGRLIKEVSNHEVEVSELRAGMYFVQVTIEEKVYTKRFIKK